MMRAGLRGVVVLLGLCAALGGCVTARPTEPLDLQLLTSALIEPVGDLRERADAGQAQAQYALALLHTYGLRGVAIDHGQAALLRRRALAARGHTPITTYIAGLQGKPGRVATVNMPRYDLNVSHVLRADQCAKALAYGDAVSAAVLACAGSDEFARLSALWEQAEPER